MVEPNSRLDQISQSLTPRKIGRGYTAFVKFLRVVLPLAALGMVAVLLAWPEGQNAVEPIRREELLPNTDTATNELLNPRYESADQNLNPFVVTAARATQNQTQPGLIYLNAPVADIALKNGGQLDVIAGEGIFEQDAEKLSLSEGVELIYDKTYTLTGEEMRVNLRTREAFSGKDVVLTGPSEKIEARGMEAYSEQGRVIFKGPGKLTLYPEQDE